MNKTTKFYSNSHMIKYLKRLKRMNPVAKIIGKHLLFNPNKA